MPTHPKCKSLIFDEGKVKRPGGPMKRKGGPADEWEEVIGPSLDAIPATQLPLKRTVLQRYRSIRIEKPLENSKALAKEISIEVEEIWNKARVPTKPHKNCVLAVTEVIGLWKSCHNPGDLNKHKAKLDSLLDLKPRLRGRHVSEEDHLQNLKCLMKKASEVKMTSETQKYNWETDYEFYIDQFQGKRIQRLGTVDFKLHNKEKDIAERRAKRLKYYEKQMTTTSHANHLEEFKLARVALDEDASSGDEDEDHDYVPPAQKKMENITLTLPRKGILAGAAEVAARCKVSTRIATAMAAKFVKMGGGKLQDCTLSISSSHRHRQVCINESASKIKSNFKANLPQFLILHWDSKVIKYEDRHETDNRLAVVASVPQEDQNHQFLAAPCIPDSTGHSQNRALIDVLQDWGIPAKVIIGMSWDTTASNTGVHRGSATLFEQELGHSILWLACRHHIGELHIKHANEQVRGKLNGRCKLKKTK
jgi:hypothetical protein